MTRHRAAPARRQRVCLLTYDFPGPIANGGIGTAFRALAETLVAEGHEVTVLYPGAYSESLPVSWWAGHWRGRGIDFVSLHLEGPSRVLGHRACQWLRAQPRFDVIHFHDWRGPGYWLTVAKRCGLAFQDTVLVAQAHAQTLWHLDHSGSWLTDSQDLEYEWLERRSVEGADVLFSPSRYFERWMEQQGWALPAARFVAPNLLPEGLPQAPPARGRSTVDELVFFGRLETRKGLELFCEAATRLLAGPGAKPRRITFLGKAGEAAGGNALAHVAAATAGWEVPWQVLNSYGVDEANAYLAGPGRLAVICSRCENSPYTVLECLAAGRPFLAPDVGGIAELADARDHPECLYERDVAALTAALSRAMAEGAAAARPSTGFAQNRAAWLAWHARLDAPAAPAVVRDAPLVSVCMTTYERPALLEHAIASIEAQGWPRLEVVLVDDASPSPAAQAALDALAPRFRARGWQLLRNERNLHVCASRNRAVRAAQGEYVLMMDDDNAAFPHEVETLVRAAQASRADIVTCQSQPFTGLGPPPRHVALHPPEWLPVGPAVSLGMFWNCLGDANLLCRREVWLALGGMSEVRVAYEDWDFLMRAALAGYRLECLPDILFAYRVWSGSWSRRIDRVASHRRVLAPALATAHPGLSLALRLGVETSLAAMHGDGHEPPADPALARIAAAPLQGAEALLLASELAALRGQKQAAALLLAQAHRLAPAAPEVALELLGREGDAPFGLEALAAELPEAMLPRAGQAIGRLLADGQTERARRLARAILDEYPDSQAARFLAEMAGA